MIPSCNQNMTTVAMLLYWCTKIHGTASYFMMVLCLMGDCGSKTEHTRNTYFCKSSCCYYNSMRSSGRDVYQKEEAMDSGNRQRRSLQQSAEKISPAISREGRSSNQQRRSLGFGFRERWRMQQVFFVWQSSQTLGQI